MARLKRKGKEYYLGSFTTKEEAQAMVDKAAQAYAEGKEIPKKLKPRKRPVKGVYRNRGRWAAHDTKTGKYIGSFSTVEQAKQAVEDFKAGRPIQKERREPKGSVRYYAYGTYKDDPKWHARFFKDGKKIHLGYYDTEEEAWEAIEKAKMGIFPEKKRTGRKPSGEPVWFRTRNARHNSSKLELYMRVKGKTEYVGTFDSIKEVEKAKQTITEAIVNDLPIPCYKNRRKAVQI